MFMIALLQFHHHHHHHHLCNEQKLQKKSTINRIDLILFVSVSYLSHPLQHSESKSSEQKFQNTMIDDDRFVMTLATVIDPIIPLTSTVSSLSISTLMQSSSQSESVMKRNNFDFSPTFVPTSTASTIERIKIETIAEISDQSDAYYGNLFNRLNLDYRSVHGYLSLGVCVFGIIANVLNIIVLTR